MERLPLEGVRVADFSWVLAGPICCKYLAAMGAEVIKVETRKRPDFTRGLGTGPVDAQGRPLLNQAPLFNSANYSKLGITLDLAHPEATELAKRLVAVSDVVIENFAHGVMERFGLGYSTLKEIRPDIIMVSSSGLGRTGPEKEYVAYGVTLHSYSGITALTAYEGGPPRGIGGVWSDPLTAITLAGVALAALHYCRRTGKGQYVDVSMAEATAALLPEPLLDYIMNRRVQGSRGNKDDFMAPHNTYLCQGEDKWVAIAVATDEEWLALCHAMGNPPGCQDARFSDVLSRWKNQQELDNLVQTWTKNHTREEVMATLQKAGIAAGPSHNTEELVNDPQLRHRGYFVEIDHPEVGRKPYTGLPWKMTPSSKVKYTHAPLLGEHNDYVFGELLGLTKEKIAQLVEEKVIY